MPRSLRLALAFFSAVACGLALAQQVTVERDSTLLAEPRAGAAVVGKVAKGTRGEAVGKHGAFLNLKTDREAGWVPSFNVRFGDASAGGGGGADASRFFGGKPQIAATIGMRGISPDELKGARFNPDQLALLDSYTATKEQGEQRASEAGLVALKLDYLVK